MSRKNSKRIYYPSGLISLILLPLISIWYLNKHHAFDKYNAIDITWWSPRLYINNPIIFPKESHPNINYINITLTGNDKEDKIKLASAQLKIRELIKSNDPSYGIRFHFNNQSNYWTLIKAIDICNIEKATIYIPYQNDIWVISPKSIISSDNKHETVDCGGALMNDVVIIKSETEKHRKKEYEFITNTPRIFYISGLLFFIMTLLTVRRIYRNQFNQV